MSAKKTSSWGTQIESSLEAVRKRLHEEEQADLLEEHREPWEPTPRSLDDTIRKLAWENEPYVIGKAFEFAESEQVFEVVAREMARAWLQRFFKGWSIDGANIESPIELAMLAGLHLAAEAASIDLQVRNPTWEEKSPSMWPGGRVRGPELLRVVPQAVIGQNRVDFLLRYADSGWVGSGYDLTEVRAVVECDGHDFHERTKEQAKRDRQRDRSLQDIGLLMLRYTGAEIWADPVGCAMQAIESLIAYHRRLFAPPQQTKD